jgi:hypothetical protein
MTNRLVIIILAIIISLSVQAQKNTYTGFPSLVWPKLYDIRFVKGTDKLGEFDKPVFSEAAKSLSRKNITLPGYIVPFENGAKSSSHFMFSSMPLNACFFCGVGGPESAVEVFLKEEIKYTDKPVEIKGVLKLNDKDPDKMIYVIENAEVIGEVEF